MNRVHEDWAHTLAQELNNNFLMDCAKGKTAYACGIAFAIHELQNSLNRKELERLRADAMDFVNDYMAGV